MPPHLPRQIMAVVVLLTGCGAAAAAAGARPAPRTLAGSRVPTVTQASTVAHPAATRTFQAAPFRSSSVPVLSYYKGVPLVPGTISDAQAQALVNAGILPPYHQYQGPGRTIPDPGALLNQFRVRERFLNTLIGGENRLISAQLTNILAASRLMSQLARVGHLLGVLPPSQLAPVVTLYRVLNSRLHNLNVSIALTDRALLVGLNNELLVFNYLKGVAPGSPDVAFYRLLILEQERLIAFRVQPPETPVVPPPDRDEDKDRRGEEERERRFGRDRD